MTYYLNRNFIFQLFICVMLICFAGCARRVTLTADDSVKLPYQLDVDSGSLENPNLPEEPQIVIQQPVVESVPIEPESGVYHKVEKGQTLWRIAKIYNVSLERLIEANNIADVAQVETNQSLLIPGVTESQEDYIEPDYNQNDFVWPVKGRVVGYFNERLGKDINKGINIQIASGNKIRASRSGRVVFSDYLIGYGYTVILDHEDGFQTVYARNKDLLVQADESVTKNTPIAMAGDDKESEVHFQIRKNSVEDNPLHYLPKQ